MMQKRENISDDKDTGNLEGQKTVNEEALVALNESSMDVVFAQTESLESEQDKPLESEQNAQVESPELDQLEEEIDEEQALFNAHFKPIPQERIKKARRTKTKLIVFIIVLLLVLGGLSYLGYTLLFANQQNHTTPDASDTKLDALVNDNTPTETISLKTTSIPNIASFFGLSATEVQSALGTDYVLTKDEAVTENENSAIKRLVVLAYQPANSGSSTSARGSVAMPSVYLSLNEESKVVEVYYQSSFEALAYPTASFSSFVNTQDMLFNALRSAGVTPASSYTYPSVTSDIYTVYVDPTADVKKVKKEEYTFTGDTSTGSNPASWQVKLSYDYGSSGVSQSATGNPNQRLFSLSLK